MVLRNTSTDTFVENSSQTVAGRDTVSARSEPELRMRRRENDQEYLTCDRRRRESSSSSIEGHLKHRYVRVKCINCHHGDAQNHTFITCIIAKQIRNASFDAKDDATMQSASLGCDTCPRREESFSKTRIPRFLTKPPAIQTNAHAFLKVVMIGDKHVREKT